MTEEERFLCKVVTWDEITDMAMNVYGQIKESKYKPDIIVALIRGGLVPARLLCDHLHLKNLYAVKVEHWGITAQADMKAKLVQGLDLDLTDKKVLLVDDITDTGESMRLANSHLEEKNPEEIRSATLLHISHSNFEPDFFDVTVPEDEWTWFIFPWNFHEDLRTLATKTLTRCRSPEEISMALKDQFQIMVKSDLVQGALEELKEQGQVIDRDGKWEKLQ